VPADYLRPSVAAVTLALEGVNRHPSDIETETDPAKRALLLRLLAEEKVKQASHPKDDK
jgi:hypothetical protein